MTEAGPFGAPLLLWLPSGATLPASTQRARHCATGSTSIRGRARSALLTYWYFHLPNFLLAALMYTLLGRAMLGLIVEPNSQNYIWRFFCRITDPVVARGRDCHAEGGRAGHPLAVRVRLAVLAQGRVLLHAVRCSASRRKRDGAAPWNATSITSASPSSA